MFVSLYNSNVIDRRLVSRFSWRAFYCWLLDWCAVRLADTVLLDTHEHIQYFTRTFGLPPHKAIRVLVGSDTSVMQPAGHPLKNSPLIIHFHGTFIPLQGIEYILQAVALLKKSEEKLPLYIIRMVGRGQEYANMRTLADTLGITNNITFIDAVPYEQLARMVQEADICLGVFGGGEKTAMVIPNKVYEAIACARPLITADTPAVREVFTDKENICLVPPADAAALAQTLTHLLKNVGQRESLVKGARTITATFTPRAIVQQLLHDLAQ
jgi:glycosyltransferase involved in cell wall biosynthesis